MASLLVALQLQGAAGVYIVPHFPAIFFGTMRHLYPDAALRLLIICLQPLHFVVVWVVYTNDPS